ncbi:MAG: hypothetical protein WC549_00455 [Actinomycetota bacterium]
MKCLLCKKHLSSSKVKKVFTAEGKPSLIHEKCDTKLTERINKDYINTLDKFFNQF